MPRSVIYTIDAILSQNILSAKELMVGAPFRKLLYTLILYSSGKWEASAAVDCLIHASWPFIPHNYSKCSCLLVAPLCVSTPSWFTWNNILNFVGSTQSGSTGPPARYVLSNLLVPSWMSSIYIILCIWTYKLALYIPL